MAKRKNPYGMQNYTKSDKVAKIIEQKEAAFEEVKAEVAKLCAAFPLYADCVM